MLCFILHARLRVHRAPGISCALFSWREGRFTHNPGEAAPRECFWLFERMRIANGE
jgi:hypothetical protein